MLMNNTTRKRGGNQNLEISTISLENSGRELIATRMIIMSILERREDNLGLMTNTQKAITMPSLDMNNLDMLREEVDISSTSLREHRMIKRKQSLRLVVHRLRKFIITTRHTITEISNTSRDIIRIEASRTADIDRRDTMMTIQGLITTKSLTTKLERSMARLANRRATLPHTDQEAEEETLVEDIKGNTMMATMTTKIKATLEEVVGAEAIRELKRTTLIKTMQQNGVPLKALKQLGKKRRKHGLKMMSISLIEGSIAITRREMENTEAVVREAEEEAIEAITMRVAIATMEMMSIVLRSSGLRRLLKLRKAKQVPKVKRPKVVKSTRSIRTEATKRETIAKRVRKSLGGKMVRK